MGFKVIYGVEPYGIKYFLDNEIRALGFDENTVVRAPLGTDILSEVYSASLFGKKYFVLSGSLKDRAVEQLLKEDPDNEVRVVIDSLDRKLSVVSRLERDRKLKVFGRLTEAEYRKFVLTHLSGKKITGEDFRYLLDRMGYLKDEQVTLFAVDTWLKQIAGAADVIDRKLIDFYVPERSTETAFRLFSYYCAEDRAGFFKLLLRLLEEGENVLGLMSTLLYSFRVAYKVALVGKERAMFELRLGAYQLQNVPETDLTSARAAVASVSEGIHRIKLGADAQNECILTACRLFDKFKEDET